MSIRNILCSGGCGMTLGTVETDSTGGRFKGDAHYGYLCDSCAARTARKKAADEEVERSGLRKMIANANLTAGLTVDESAAVLRRLGIMEP